MHPRLIALFFLFLLAGSTFAYSVPNPTSITESTTQAGEKLSPQPAQLVQANHDTYTVISFQAATPSSPGTCRLSELSEVEVQRLKDNILTPGIVGQELSSGAIPNTSRATVSDRTTLLIPNPSDSETAFQKEVPTRVLKPSELSLLQNQSITGPIAFGLSLDDSLRAARCTDESKCAVTNAALQYRNSGEGISGSVKDMYRSFTDSSDSVNDVLNQEDADYLRAQLESERVLQQEDADTLNVQTFSRTPSADVMNHIRVDNTLQAGLLTNCDNGSCVVTIYSMFDKYFNSWFSGELVVGTFGPTVWGQFKKLAVNGRRFNFIKTDLLSKIPGFSTEKLSRTAILDAKGGIRSTKTFFEKRGLDGKIIEGDEFFRNLKKVSQRDADVGDIYKVAFVDQKITSGGAYPGLEDALFGPSGPLTNLTDIEKRRQLFTNTAQIKKWGDVVGEYDSVLKEYVNGNAKLGIPKDRIFAARGYSQLMADADDIVSMDLRSTMKKLPESDFGGLVIADASTEISKLPPRSIVELDDKYFNDMMNSFAKTGDFSEVKYIETVKDPVTKKVLGIVQYDTKKGAFIGPLDLTKIQNGTYPAGAFVDISGRPVPATKEFLNEITNASGGSSLSVFASTTTKKVDAAGNPILFTPQMLTDRILAADIMRGKISKIPQNMGSLVDTMVARDFGGGPYTNWLSRSLQTQQKLVSNYFKFHKLEGGLITTGQTYLYWALTKGFGSDKFSVYQLPESWTEARFTPGEQDFYQDAYVDFFANEGSDTGDIFQKVISNLPAPLIIESIAQEFGPMQRAWEWLNGGAGRSTPDNLAMYLFGSPACENCTAAINSPTSNRFDVQYISPENVTSFFLEHGKSDDAKEKGQLLTLYSHHTNVDGEYNGNDLDQINLVDARNNGETCEQVMSEVPVYGGISKLVGAERLGAVMAVAENLSYAAGGLTGVFVTAANQGLVAPKMAECVDDKEGYFASLYVPHSTLEDNKTKTIQKNASENALDGIRSLAEQVKRENPEPSLTDKVLNEATSKVQELVDDAQDNGVAEADLRITGSSSGYLRSQEVVYFWMGGGSLAQPNQYTTEGKTIISDEKGNTITLDNESGTLSVNGIEVISASEADHTRLANKNLEIPAVEIPQRVNGYTLNADTNQLMVSINVRGESVVQDPALLDCIQSAVLAQSAVPLNSNNMTEAFGKVESVATDAFPNIAIDPSFNSGKGRILMGGQVSYAATGAGASVQIYGNRNVQVTGLTNPNASNAGKMNSVLLENGSIIYKPQTNELLIWLRHHAAAVVSDDEVKNFTGTLTNTTNPTNSCDEPAINLAVETDPSTPATKLKGDNLTAGLEKNGPFQVFETENKRFILYSKLVDGECKQFFKVIDKNTGEVYDQPIEDIFQNEDGTITIKTEDGLSHSLKFTDENGKPVLTYDGQSEVLRSASGKGGSFYYDPNKGMYYAENAQLIPLNENFKNQGVGFQANPDGTVSGKAGDNVFNINTAQGGEGLFNIPSLPETLAGLLAFVLLIGLVCAGIYLDQKNKSSIINQQNR
ncbi:MAG: hypothetical protein FJY86_01850 [Candidatus Diapherotrites archaeon]|uniref:Uncharacterized protein n=1 Tax=Candidatus Iainarchaeum sp. TaxID=3101447 RepID=A0A8T4C6C8_9ARCH|nr:hypothetical protein [Candidatus Diapherotrites archaeon]